jgi:hypothetical protein
MNKCILQIWEESERGWGTRPAGCSVHLDENEHKSYLELIYSKRDDIVPNEYDRVVGGPIVCFVSDFFYEEIKLNKTIRLMENEKNNLIKMEDIIFNVI